ncbi:HNH endonuclease [Arthrobacter sp. OV608]|nr:HNH endonuclease [Arthrobacter sp. OV608]
MVKAFEDIKAALAVLNAEAEGCCSEPFSDADPLAGLGDGCLDILAGARAAEAGFAALKARAAVTYADTAQLIAGPEAPVQALEMSVAAEIGALLALGPRAAGAFLAASHAITKERPLTFSALQAGTITWPHALVMAEETAGLDPAGAAALESHFLDPEVSRPSTAAPVGELPAYRFRAKARKWRERHHPESIEKRHAKCAADRRMEYTPDRDGMARVSLYVPADQASAIWNRTTALARGLQGPDEPRTMTQLRPDIVASILLGAGTALHPGPETSPEQSSTEPSSTGQASTEQSGAGQASTEQSGAGQASTEQSGAGQASTEQSGAGESAPAAGKPGETHAGAGLGDVPVPRADVLVTVPVLALFGITDEPANLDGYGPIPASMARTLVANGASSFYRVLVDPRDGAPLEIGRTSYRLTKAMKKALQLRDGRCTFPGCNNPSMDNEADHLQAWQHGGTTGIGNLAQLCPKHHRLKHSTGWTPTAATQNEPPGWTSPTGRHYKAEHHDWEPPRWPQQLKPGQLGHARINPTCLPPDFVYGPSPGEQELERFLHAPPA